MTRIDHKEQRNSWRHGLLASAAALALGIASPAFAQQQGSSAQSQPSQAPSQQAGSNQPQVVGQLRTAEQALRQSQNELSGSGQPNFAQARTAVDSGMNVIGRVPQDMQGQPTVTVQQPEPVVTVVVPQPEIIVRQAPPQVTVQMPQPQVAVQQQQPQVRVAEAQPNVQVQPGQPQVQVQQAQPRVIVQQQGQPQIRFEQTGQPVVNLEGQVAASASAQTGASSVTPVPAQSGGAQPQQAAASPAAGMSLQSVQNLVGTNVVGTHGREAGEVRNLLIDNSGRVRAAVVEWGGFLGIGERQAMVPIERIQLGQGNERARLNMTRQELEALPRYERDGVAAYGRERGWGEGLRLFR